MSKAKLKECCKFLTINKDRNEGSELRACRGCLATDTGLKKLNRDVCVSLSQITGNPVQLEDPLPQYICSTCHYLAMKYAKFRRKCVNAAVILNRYLLWNKLNTKNIKAVDRSEIDTRLILTKTNVEIDSYKPARYNPNLKITGILHLDINTPHKPSHNSVEICRSIGKVNIKVPINNKHQERLRELQECLSNDDNRKVIINYMLQYPQHDTSTAEESTNGSTQDGERETLVYNDLVEEHADKNDNNDLLFKDLLDEDSEHYEALAHDADSSEDEHQTADDITDNQNIMQKDNPNTFFNDWMNEEHNEDPVVDLSCNEAQEHEQDELIDTKDDIIVKEENLIHPVDDDVDETVETSEQKDNETVATSEQKVNETVANSELKDNEKVATSKPKENKSREIAEYHTVGNSQETSKIYDVGSSSSSSSSSSSDSDSSSSSDSDDEIEMQEIKPAEIDLTGDDDDNNVPPNDLKDNTEAVNGKTSLPYEKDKPINAPQVKTAETTKTTNDSILNTTDNDKSHETNDETKEGELNIDKDINTTIADAEVNVTEADVTIQNDQSSLQPITNVQLPATDLIATDNDEEVSHPSVQENNAKALKNVNSISSSSDSDDDMPDCLIGLSKDIYKKDIKRNFSASETSVDHKREKVKYVDEIYVNDKNGIRTKKRSVDEICSNVKSDDMIRIGEFDKVRHEFESKRKKRYKVKQRYVKSRINRNFIVPR